MCPDLETGALLEICSTLGEFVCIAGDRTAWHTTALGERHRYITLGFIGDEALGVVRALVAELRAVRRTLPANPMPTLYLRSGPELERNAESGDFTIYMRVAIPGVDWSEFRVKREGGPFLPALTAQISPIQ